MAVRTTPGRMKPKSPRSFFPRPVANPDGVKMHRSGNMYRADLGGGRSMYRSGDTYRYEDEEGNEVVRKGNMLRTGKKGNYKYKRLKSTDFKKPGGNVPKAPKKLPRPSFNKGLSEEDVRRKALERRMNRRVHSSRSS